MKLPALKPSSRTLTLLAVVTALIFFGGILTYTVCARHLKAAVTDYESKQKQVEDSRKTATRLLDSERNYLMAQSELAFLESTVASWEYVPTLLQQLERLAESHNLKVVSVRPQVAPPAAPPPIKRTSEDPETASGSKSSGGNDQEAQEKPKPYKELKLDVEVEGTYFHIRDFMDRLTMFPKILAVQQLQLSPTTVVQLRASPRLTAKMSVTAFVFPGKGIGGDEPKPATSPPVTTKAVAHNWRSDNEG